MVYFLILITVILHELAHVAFLNYFGVKTEKIIITPFGCVAFSQKIYNLKYFERLIVYAVGPFVNLFIGLTCLILFKDRFFFFRNSQFLLFIFNMLPIYPFDGSQILYAFLKQRFSDLIVNKVIFKISRVLSIALIFLGVFQLFIYKYNVTLLVIGIFTFFVSKKIYTNNVYDFYKKKYTK